MIPFWETLLRGSLYISAVGIMAWYWLRAQKNRPQATTELIAIKSRRSVGHQQQLLLVSVKGREILLAQTASTISFLTNLPADLPDKPNSQISEGLLTDLDIRAISTSGTHLAKTSSCNTPGQLDNCQIAANDI